MAAHNTEALDERGTMVLVGHAAVKIVHHNLRQLEQGQPLLLGTLHHTYTPVYIGRESVSKVVRLCLGNVGAHIESLVAYKHAVTEGAPVEVGRRSETTRTQQVAVVVYNVGAAIKHGRQPTVRTLVDVVGYIFKRHVIGQHIAGIEKHHIVARGFLQRLVHGIIQTAVGFGADDNVVLRLLLGVALSVGVDQSQGVVLGCSVYNYVFYLCPRLVEYAVKGALKHAAGVVGTG